MNSKQYLDRLLLRYSGTFNIYKPYHVADMEFDAYGYFYNHLEKYVLVRDANLWSSDCYEHVFFITSNCITKELIHSIEKLIKEVIEPDFVRKGEKLPPQNHMYSYITMILISEQIPDKETVKAIKKSYFEKGYNMNIRGYSQSHMNLVSVEEQKVYTNRAGKKSRKMLEDIFEEVKQNKIGFEELCNKHNIEPFKQ